MFRELYSRAFEHIWAGCACCKSKGSHSYLSCSGSILIPSSGSMIMSFPESREVYISSRLLTLDSTSCLGTLEAFWIFPSPVHKTMPEVENFSILNPNSNFILSYRQSIQSGFHSSSLFSLLVLPLGSNSIQTKKMGRVHVLCFFYFSQFSAQHTNRWFD